MAVSRLIWIVVDSLGVGELPDAAAYGDAGSHTVAHIGEAVPLQVPTLRALGLDRLVPSLSVADRHDQRRQASPSQLAPLGAYGRMAEASAGKDSVTGHWEMTGIILDRPFPTFSHGFPRDLMQEFERRIARRTLGNVVASGTVILDRLGAAHLQTGSPIVYTSADSVFQIAAHEDVVPVDALYGMCEVAFDLAARGLGVARVIARPFVGIPGAFVRTANRKDFTLEPTGLTVLDYLQQAGHAVVGIGKIHDLFSGRGLTRSVHTTSDTHGMDALDDELRRTPSGVLFCNLVDFDALYGHRNDIAGYAANLERFDVRLGQLLAVLGPSDLLVVTADHGNDPSTVSTDHSREYVPVFVAGRAVSAGVDLGTRDSFADLGQTVAELFALPRLAHGRSFLREILKPGDPLLH
ncbi:MAG: phosphopentomutase [Vicinamibacterales bacterium]